MMSYQDQVTGIAAELEEILDLDDLEAKVYLNLLRAGPITASALAKELDIDRARMYRTVDKLVSRNIISTTLSSPKLCIAADPHDALKIALGKKEDEVNKIKKSGESIINKINNEIDELSALKRDKPELTFEIDKRIDALRNIRSGGLEAVLTLPRTGATP